MDAIRTPDEVLEGLPDFPYEPHYREVDGLRLPFITRDPNSLITLTEVKHNLPLDDARFFELKDCFTQ